MTPFNTKDFYNEEKRHILIDEFDALFFESNFYLGLMTLKQVSGVTATAVKIDKGASLEEQLYRMMKFEVLNLFPNI